MNFVHNRFLPRLLAVLFIVTVTFSMTSCEDEKKEKVQIQPIPFKKNTFTSITPLVSGGAYALAIDGQIWFLHDQAATQVTVKKSDDKIPSLSEITPRIEGGAYAIGDSGEIWVLHDAVIEKVTEASMEAAPILKVVLPEKALFTLYTIERQKRLAAKAKQESDQANYEQDRYENGSNEP